MKLIPIEDKVVVKYEHKQEQRIGGIIIPDTAKDKPKMGTIFAVSSDESVCSLFKVGDVVVYNTYSGTEIEIEDQKYLILSKKDILAIVD